MTLARRWMYRTQQFWHALSERYSSVSDEFLKSHLDGDAQVLFRTMSRRDQAHSAATAQRLAGDTMADQDLLQAALLHDVGKGQQTTIQRVAYVILAATDRSALARLARNGDGLRGALYRSVHHPALGAVMAARAGCSRRVCVLIAQHHQAPIDDASRALQWADEVA